MSNPDDMKGRAKEAAGDLTDNERLKREGKADQAEGALKEGVDNVRESLGKAADKLDKDR
jgi:uncharacterized protein YjbJ (UPF0337 family)